MTKLNEKEIIDLFFSRLLKKNKIELQIRDDVSLLSFKDLRKNKVRSFNSYNVVIKSDMLVESTDVVKQMKIWQIARKSIVSAVSDMSAKGIKPPYFSLLSLAIPSSWTKNKIKNLILGFKKASKKFGTLLGKYFSSSIDSSDGLGISLYELAKQSKVDFYIDDIPVPRGLIEFAKNNSLDIYDLIFNGGEEYEILATINPSNLQKVNFLVKKFHLPMFVIGKAMIGSGNVFIKYSNKLELFHGRKIEKY